MTPAGWAYYQELRGQVNESAAITAGLAPAIAGTPPAQLFPRDPPARDTGGLAGFYLHAPSGVPSVPYLPPVRASYCEPGSR